VDNMIRKIPKSSRTLFKELVSLTDTFCDKYLNNGYRQLCREMAMTLCRKRKLIMNGKPEGWASGIVGALGTVNFLFDKNFKPYMSIPEIARGFGISESTMSGRSKIIRDLLKLMPFDPRWCLPDMKDDNPFIWMIEIDGFMIDIRHMPLDIQKEALELGLIPYIPEKKEKSEADDIQKTTKPKPKPPKMKNKNQGELF